MRTDDFATRAASTHVEALRRRRAGVLVLGCVVQLSSAVPGSSPDILAHPLSPVPGTAQLVDDGVGASARLYSIPSHEAWKETLALLQELRTPPDKMDRDAQVVITRLRPLADATLRDRVAESIALTSSARVQFHVFVSPYAEPARVYVAALVDADDRLPAARNAEKVYRRRHFAVRSAESWLLDRLSHRLGTPGQPVPQGVVERAALTRALLAPGASTECLGRLESLPSKPTDGAAMTPPTPISITHIRPSYPAGELERANTGSVQVEGTVQEDGVVSALKVVCGASANEFAAAALQAAALWRFTPTRVDGCPVPAVIKLNVSWAPR